MVLQKERKERKDGGTGGMVEQMIKVISGCEHAILFGIEQNFGSV